MGILWVSLHSDTRFYVLPVKFLGFLGVLFLRLLKNFPSSVEYVCYALFFPQKDMLKF